MKSNCPLQCAGLSNKNWSTTLLSICNKRDEIDKEIGSYSNYSCSFPFSVAATTTLITKLSSPKVNEIKGPYEATTVFLSDDVIV